MATLPSNFTSYRPSTDFTEDIPHNYPAHIKCLYLSNKRPHFVPFNFNYIKKVTCLDN